MAGVAECAVRASVRRGHGGERDGLGVWRVGREDLEHHGQGLRPGDQRVEDGARPAVAAASRDGGDLQGRPGRDRRLGAERLGPDRGDLRPRVHLARRDLAGVAEAEPCPGRRRRRRGGQQDRRGRGPGRWRPGAHHRGLRRQSLEGRGGHTHAARASRCRLGRSLCLRRRRAGAGVGQELAGARALRPVQRPLDQAAGHADGERQRVRGRGRRATDHGGRRDSDGGQRRRPGLRRDEEDVVVAAAYAHRPSRRGAGRARRLALRDRRSNRTRTRGIDPQGRGPRPQSRSLEGSLPVGR